MTDGQVASQQCVRCGGGGGGGGGGIMPLCTSSVSNTVQSQVNHFLPVCHYIPTQQPPAGHYNYLVQHQIIYMELLNLICIPENFQTKRGFSLFSKKMLLCFHEISSHERL